MVDGRLRGFGLNPLGSMLLSSELQVCTKLWDEVHEVILSLDSKLGKASDREMRIRLVSAAYTLRILEEFTQKSYACLCLI